MADNAKIDEILGYVLAYPHAHDQDSYFYTGTLTSGIGALDLLRTRCGTTACIAGWAIASAALTNESLQGAAYRLLREAGHDAGTGEPYDLAAAHILQLTRSQADAIFHCCDRAAAIARLKHVRDHPRVSWDDLTDACPAGEDA